MLPIDSLELNIRPFNSSEPYPREPFAPTDWKRAFLMEINATTAKDDQLAMVRLQNIESGAYAAIYRDDEGYKMGVNESFPRDTLEEVEEIPGAKILVKWESGDSTMDYGRLEGAILTFTRNIRIQHLILHYSHYDETRVLRLTKSGEEEVPLSCTYFSSE